LYWDRGLLYNWRSNGWKRGTDGKLRQSINIYSVGADLNLISHINSVLCSDEPDELVTVLTDNDGPEMTGYVVPGDAVVVFIVEGGQAGLVMELLQPLDSDTDIVLCLDGSLPDALLVVRLGRPCLSGCAPEGVGIRSVRSRNPGVAGSGPEPAVHVDGLEMGTVAALVLEVAFPTAGPHARDVVFIHDILEHLELAGRIEGDQVHAPVPAEVPPVEPVPVLKLMPGFPPGQEVIVLANLHVGLPFHAFFEHWSVQQGLPIISNPGRSLSQTAGEK